MFSLATRFTARLGLLGLLCAAAVLPGCARWSDTAKTFFASSTPAVAMVGPQLLQGELQVYSDYSGFLTLVSVTAGEPTTSCSGRLPNTNSLGREIDLRCSNGSMAHLRLSMRSDLRGYAYGGEGPQAVSLAFGLDPGESAALLRVPAGQVLVYRDGRYALAQAPGGTAAHAAPLPPAEAAGGAADAGAAAAPPPATPASN